MNSLIPLFFIVEGETEQLSLPALLESHFRNLGAKLQCILIGQNRPTLGGGRFSLTEFNKHVSRLIYKHRGCFISTCFDYYKLGNGWPGYSDIHSRGMDKYAEVDELEASLMTSVRENYRSGLLFEHHFIPYIQLHEFETLFFAQPDIFSSIFDNTNICREMKKIIKQFHNCELINNNYDTCPSRRLLKLTNNAYKKGKTSSAQGPIFMKNADLTVLREKCKHFNAWLTTIEKNLSEYQQRTI